MTFLHQDADVKGALDKLNNLMETEEKLVIAVMFADVQESKKTIRRVEETTERTERSVGKVDQTTERTEKTVVRMDKTMDRVEKNSEIHQKTLESFVKGSPQEKYQLTSANCCRRRKNIPEGPCKSRTHQKGVRTTGAR